MLLLATLSVVVWVACRRPVGIGVEYAGGTEDYLEICQSGRFALDSEADLVFDYGWNGSFAIPYKDIQEVAFVHRPIVFNEGKRYPKVIRLQRQTYASRNFRNYRLRVKVMCS